MISDDVLRTELNASLKKQKIKIKDRNELIKLALCEPIDDRDALLEKEDLKARKFIQRAKDKKNVPSEFKEQCEFVSWFKVKFPNIVIMSIRNGGYRTASERVEQIMEGLHAGAADLYIPEWHCWVEFKKKKGGILSEKQEKFRDYVIDVCGDSWFLALGFEDGKEKILKHIEDNA